MAEESDPVSENATATGTGRAKRRKVDAAAAAGPASATAAGPPDKPDADPNAYHTVGACVLQCVVTQAELTSLASPNLVMQGYGDSYVMDTPALYDVQASGKRHLLGLVEGFLTPRCSAESFWLGMSAGPGVPVKIVGGVLPDAGPQRFGKKGHPSTDVLFIVKVQCANFDVRYFKTECQDSRPQRAVNALKTYMKSPGCPAACGPYERFEALGALSKRAITIKDLK